MTIICVTIKRMLIVTRLSGQYGHFVTFIALVIFGNNVFFSSGGTYRAFIGSSR